MALFHCQKNKASNSVWSCRRLSTLAITLGLILNFSGVQGPSFYTGLNLVLVPMSTFLMLFAIGRRLRFRIGKGHITAALLLTAGKTLIVPPVLYRLDQDFAGSILMVSNTAILLILPILGFLLQV
ncbi:MAG: hypothetical protein A3J97_10180 [Spirochaetes bacterium RIFOXYC1_FULL_54_7]|nr:MAG: hypothetical protein A3J97_10180 [Spirochaetes bacterium RIFOXYC1_FULL_54_7]